MSIKPFYPAIILIVATAAWAQTRSVTPAGVGAPPATAAARGTRDRTSPVFSSAPDIYSGISGPGSRVISTGWGGYRSGREGVMYRGDNPMPKPGWLPLGDRAKATAVWQGILPPLRPIWEIHLRDTIIRPGGDGMYYMTGSSGDNIWDRNDGIELWKSPDLQKWEYVGLVWNVDKDGTWQKGSPYVWAPEVIYINGTYYLPFCMAGGRGNGTGILKSTSGKPEGPYINPIAGDARTGGGIDASLFQDDNGKVYFANGGGGSILLMKPDMSGFDGEPHRVQVDRPADAIWREGQVSLEGVSIFKREGKYYLTGAAFYRGRYSSVATISDNIFGPYKQWHEAVPCAGGGNYFHDKEGNWYCTYFGNDDQSPWREKPGLVKVDFKADGTIFIAEEQPAWLIQPGAPTKWRMK